MEIEILDLLVRYLETLSDDTPRNRVLWTVALFLRDDERIAEVARRTQTFDTGMLEEIASLASPIELSVMLERLSASMPGEVFERLLNSALQSTSDIRALRELGSAAAWYWHRRPGAIDFSRELVDKLLDSPDVDGRIVGLKVMRRYYPEPVPLFHRIMQALCSFSSSERCGGTYELTQCLDDSEHRFVRSLSTEQAAQLRAKIEGLSQFEDDYPTRENAKNCQRWLGEHDTSQIVTQ